MRERIFGKLGIIAGSGNLPLLILSDYIKANSQNQCFVAFIQHNDRNLFLECSNYLDKINKHSHKKVHYQFFPIGMVGQIQRFFKTHEVENIVIVGKTQRPKWNSLKVDLEGSILISKILKNKLLGDDNLLRVVTKYFEDLGFNIISPNRILLENKEKKAETTYTATKVTKNLPSENDAKDIAMGVKVLSTLGNLDIGQAIIVEQRYVLGIEAAEGTDELIKRCAKLKKNTKGGVLVKIPKIGQDIRVDTPVIGLNTATLLVENNFSGVSIKENEVIVMDEKKTICLLEENDLFLNFCDTN